MIAGPDILRMFMLNPSKPVALLLGIDVSCFRTKLVDIGGRENLTCFRYFAVNKFIGVGRHKWGGAGFFVKCAEGTLRAVGMLC